MLKAFNARRELFICLFLIIVTLAVFSSVKDYDFINYDDDVYVTENFHVHSGVTLKSMIWAFTTFHAGNWHPLTWLSHMLDIQLYGLKPGGHHITSLVFHIINTLLLFLVLHRMTKALWQCAFVAAVFALHPLHVESVAWVAERKDVLSAFFWMLTMGAYGFYVERPGLQRYMLTISFFALGLMAKPMLVTLPLVLLLLDYWPLRRLQLAASGTSNHADMRIFVNPKRKKRKAQKSSVRDTSQEKSLRFAYQWASVRLRLLEKVPFLFLSGISSLVTIYAQKKGGALSSLESLPVSVRIENALISYVQYLGKMLCPINSAVFYPHPGMLPLWQVFGAAVLIVVITLLVIWAVTRLPCLAVGWLWYLGTLVPVIGIVQVGSQGMADRYTYIPLIGVMIMIAWGVPDILKGWRYQRIALSVSSALILSLLMIGAWVQVQYWQNSVTLFSHALGVTSNNYVAHHHLGSALQNQGKIEEAISHYSESLRIYPNSANVQCNLGTALQDQGRLKEATTHYTEALRINPNHAVAHNNLGTVLHDQGRLKEAITHYTEALRINPSNVKAHSNMGKISMLQGKTEEAITYYTEAIRIKPDYIESYLNLGEMFASQGKYSEALTLYSKALQIKPDSGEIHYNMGIMLAFQGNMDEAIYHFREAVRIKPEYAKAHNNLGSALLLRGKREDAIVHFREALRHKPDYTMAQENLKGALNVQKKSR